MNRKHADAFQKKATRAGFQVKTLQCRCPMKRDFNATTIGHGFHVAIFGHGMRKNMTLAEGIQFLTEFKAGNDK